MTPTSFCGCGRLARFCWAGPNMHELAIGITTVSSLDGQTRNPYDPTRNPGGSSGGAAAAVAASFAAIAYGPDTCGSLRIPAAFNALFALRPTPGLISMDGIMPLSHSQDVPGPMARTVGDLAAGLDAVAGLDPADPTMEVWKAMPPPAFGAALRQAALRGARIGVLAEWFETIPVLQSELADMLGPPTGPGSSADLLGDIRRIAQQDSATISVATRAINGLTAAGATVVTLRLAQLDSMLAGTSVIDHEFKFDLNDYLAHTPAAPVDSLGDILAAGLYHPTLEQTLRERNAPRSLDSEEYLGALERRRRVRDALLAVLERENLDAIVYPTMRREPARIGAPQRGSTCQLSAATGLPAISMPAGFDEDGLPVGIELIGRPFDDARLVGFAYAYEQAWRPRRSPPSTPPLSR